MPQSSHGIDEGIELSRLGNEGIGPELVKPFDVGIGLGGGKDNDGDAAQDRVGFDFPQRFAAIFSRKVQIEKNESWTGSIGRWCKLAATKQVIKQLLPVLNEPEI